KENESCHFFFTTPKTETSNREIPLLPETEAILKRVHKKQLRNRMLYATQWKNEEPFDDMVFTTQQGMPIRYGDVNRTIKTVILKANLQEEELAKFENREPFTLKPFTPHCFRHTFVTRCKINGVPYETIQLYVGHSDKETTAYYNHEKPEIDISTLNKVSFLSVV
ncbi:MAG: site-specific integrase, partial [Faecalimonas umbilicata]